MSLIAGHFAVLESRPVPSLPLHTRRTRWARYCRLLVVLGAVACHCRVRAPRTRGHDRREEGRGRAQVRGAHRRAERRGRRAPSRPSTTRAISSRRSHKRVAANKRAAADRQANLKSAAPSSSPPSWSTGTRARAPSVEVYVLGAIVDLQPGGPARLRRPREQQPAGHPRPDQHERGPDPAAPRAAARRIRPAPSTWSEDSRRPEAARRGSAGAAAATTAERQERHPAISSPSAAARAAAQAGRARPQQPRRRPPPRRPRSSRPRPPPPRRVGAAPAPRPVAAAVAVVAAAGVLDPARRLAR